MQSCLSAAGLSGGLQRSWAQPKRGRGRMTKAAGGFIRSLATSLGGGMSRGSSSGRIGADNPVQPQGPSWATFHPSGAAWISLPSSSNSHNSSPSSSSYSDCRSSRNHLHNPSSKGPGNPWSDHPRAASAGKNLRNIRATPIVSFPRGLLWSSSLTPNS